MDVSKDRVFTPQIIHLNRVFHEINHPFWGVPLFLETPILMDKCEAVETTGGLFLSSRGLTGWKQLISIRQIGWFGSPIRDHWRNSTNCFVVKETTRPKTCCYFSEGIPIECFRLSSLSLYLKNSLNMLCSSKPLKVKYTHSKFTSTTPKSWKKHIFYLYPSLSNYITTNFQPNFQPSNHLPSRIIHPSPPSLAIALPIPKLLGSSKVLRSTSHTVSLSSSWGLVSRFTDVCFQRDGSTGRRNGAKRRGAPPSAAKSSRPKAWRWSFTRSFLGSISANVPWSKVAFFLGMGNLPPLIGILIMGISTPTDLGWWVYPLLYGNNGSLDPGTNGFKEMCFKKVMHHG